ncbi:DUF3888 domain-containing protein [Clostridium sp. CM027]|uniref:DUF3888 domain-containing protein n=1 Tax=Clostridium sp. CM027 TaxID=2849865 RepID=UPI001C6ECCE2|nr:DUF3888 domain-containing protein [Clostridium sp. CM027]MBW9144488.1 DUF3888 domain-containing protein [Clostridium sp. CM027]UVE40740.1 DUF3888 domain-containing protein [Clostridium sp. CM027]
MKKAFISVLLIILISLSPKNVYSYTNCYTNQVKNVNQQELYKGSLLSLLSPYISDEVDKYYGHPKQYDLWDAKISSIKKTPEMFEYEITVQVETFTGPHNPPMAIETITILTSPMGTKVVNFKHKAE